jgi:hypothetical protein
MYFFALTIWAGALQQRVLTGVSTAARTIITGYASTELVPAVLAQAVVGLANAFATVDANRRPKKLIQTVQGKNAGLFQFLRIHTENYKRKQSLFQIKQRVPAFSGSRHGCPSSLLQNWFLSQICANQSRHKCRKYLFCNVIRHNKTSNCPCLPSHIVHQNNLTCLRLALQGLPAGSNLGFSQKNVLSFEKKEVTQTDRF